MNNVLCTINVQKDDLMIQYNIHIYNIKGALYGHNKNI